MGRGAGAGLGKGLFKFVGGDRARFRITYALEFGVWTGISRLSVNITQNKYTINGVTLRIKNK